jgi:hypothetical protein
MAMSLSCGTEPETVIANNQTANNEEVDCLAMTSTEECFEAAGDEYKCHPLRARIFDDELDCFGPQEFISCENISGNLNQLTPARHTDGTCAEFSAVFLPTSGEWTEDYTCASDEEKGICEMAQPGDTNNEPDCSTLSEMECRIEESSCSTLRAKFYNEELACSEDFTFVACAPTGDVSVLTPARHVDGTCATFAGSTLPPNGEWTADEDCNFVDAGDCE